MSKMNFIKTTDKVCYEELLRNGFTLVGTEGNAWVFINDGPAHFDSDDKRAFYSNTLTV